MKMMMTVHVLLLITSHHFYYGRKSAPTRILSLTSFLSICRWRWWVVVVCGGLWHLQRRFSFSKICCLQFDNYNWLDKLVFCSLCKEVIFKFAGHKLCAVFVGTGWCHTFHNNLKQLGNFFVCNIMFSSLCPCPPPPPPPLCRFNENSWWTFKR